jgi:hypothetical protein
MFSSESDIKEIKLDKTMIIPLGILASEPSLHA